MRNTVKYKIAEINPLLLMELDEMFGD